MFLLLSLKHKQYATIINVYAPTMANADDEKEGFCSDLDKFHVSTLVSDKPIIMGDFNARFGSNV